jgi:hypothetical protein
VDAFDRAMNIDATHEISRFNKGIVLFHDLKDEKGALAAWESLLAINPEAKSPGGQTVRELVDHIKETPGMKMNKADLSPGCTDQKGQGV